ncbi:MAG: hypothetical protein NXI20_08810 [bacterium]|nr:hypothetical protein [bacterium]
MKKVLFDQLSVEDRLRLIFSEGRLIAQRWYETQQFELYKLDGTMYQVIYKPFSDKVLNVHERTLDEGCLHFYSVGVSDQEMKKMFGELGIEL